MREAEQQARKNLRQPGSSHQTITLRCRLYVRQDKTGKVSVGGEVASNLPTEPVAGSADIKWESGHETGVLGYVELTKTVVLTGEAEED
jgi:hypothetical protein